MNPLKQQQLALPLGMGYCAGPRAHALFRYAELIIWIRDLMPELLITPEEHAQTLDDIHHYLFETEDLDAPILEHYLTEELYGCLYGLKAILASFNYHWPAAMACLEEHSKLPLTASSLALPA